MTITETCTNCKNIECECRLRNTYFDYWLEKINTEQVSAK